MNKQEIEAKARKLANKAGWPNKETQRIAREVGIEMALWMQQNQSGMRWVSGIENFPNDPANIRLARPKDFRGPYDYFAGNFGLNEGEGMFQALSYPDGPYWYSLSEIEWLDLDASSEVERLRKENEEMLEMLKECKIQIEYLHRKFQPTGTGEVVISRADSLIQKIEANGK